jgi:F-type H+-transporting ATPase subunit a
MLDRRRSRDTDALHHDWTHWRDHDHANAQKPFDEFLKAKMEGHKQAFTAWKEKQVAAAGKDRAAEVSAKRLTLSDFLNNAEAKAADLIPSPDYAWFSQLMGDTAKQSRWEAAAAEAGNWKAYCGDTTAPEWSREKIDGYNQHLSGKILIPTQLTGGMPRNLYEPGRGFSVSKFMVIELLVGLILVLVLGWLGRKVQPGGSPRGLAWNLLESFYLFIRDEIAKPALGGHDHDHDLVEHEEHFEGVDVHGTQHGLAVHERGHGPGHPPHHDHGHGKGHHGPDPVEQFTPLLCTLFFFILGMNLSGMIPWVGAPTGSWGVTFGLAMVTFATVVFAGMRQFGVAGFFLNQIPSMDMHPAMGAILKPAIFIIEIGGLLIKHAVLSVRLLANMVAGHLVLLAILGLAFGAQAALQYQTPEGVSGWWWVAAPISVLGCALLSLLELFVAFLQAYVFTLLSALFIGASIHKH